MANKNKKSQIHQANQRKIKQQQYDAATKNLFIFPCITLGLSVIALLSFFANFAEVYASGVGVETGVSGWSFIIAAITGNYTSPSAVYGDLAVPYYTYAQQWCETLSIVALFAALIALINVVVQIFAIVKKMHLMNAVSAVLSVITVVLLIVCYAQGLDMKNGEILSVFCGGNPICSIKSYAIVPAIIFIGAAAVSVVATVKHVQASSLLK